MSFHNRRSYVSPEVTVRYEPYIKQGFPGSIFYRDLRLSYKERIVSEGVRGPIYKDDPHLKSFNYSLKSDFGECKLYYFPTPNLQNHLTIKGRIDFSKLLDTPEGVQLLKEEFMADSQSSIDGMRRFSGTCINHISRGGFNPQMDIIRALGLLSELHNEYISTNIMNKEDKNLIAQQIRSALIDKELRLEYISSEQNFQHGYNAGFVHILYTDAPLDSYIVNVLEISNAI